MNMKVLVKFIFSALCFLHFLPSEMDYIVAKRYHGQKQFKVWLFFLIFFEQFPKNVPDYISDQECLRRAHDGNLISDDKQKIK